jgi:pullulanase/glycogen debranching enzyme
MKENLKDILSHLNPEVDQETLLLYLQGKLTPEKQHELEMQMMDNDFTADAFEGLDNFRDKKKLALIVEQLNNDLKKKTEKKKKLRKKLELKTDPTLWVAIVIILILVVISYLIIHKQMQGG